MRRVSCLLASCALAASALGNAHGQWPMGKDPAEQKLKLAEPGGTITITGRFQMFVSPNVKGHTFMLDTETGRIWILKKDNTSAEFSLQRVPVEQLDGQQPTAPPGK
jgi:hypothetical protein